MSRLLIMSFLGFLLSGCVTSYKSAGIGGGYSEMALSEDTYKVSFKGNGFTSKEYVQNSLLRRCAEITLQSGNKYFIVLVGQTDVNSSLMQTPSIITTRSSGVYNGYLYGNSYNGYGNSNSSMIVNPGEIRSINRYNSTVLMKVVKNNKKFPQALNAEIILNNWGSSQ